jgi:hypothetical protein
VSIRWYAGRIQQVWTGVNLEEAFPTPAVETLAGIPVDARPQALGESPLACCIQWVKNHGRSKSCFMTGGRRNTGIKELFIRG